MIRDSELTEHDLGLKIDGPAQPPPLSSFPESKFGSQKRSFQAAYYSCFLFLEYSVQKDLVFCFSCRHFPTPNADTAFTKVGVKNWKKLKKNFSNMQNPEVTSMAREAGSNLNQQAQLVSSLRN